MNNCKPCKPKEQESNNCKCTIKQLIDECTGNTINYITLASAVLMDCGSEETVKQAIEDLRTKLDNKFSSEDIETLLHLMTVYLNSHRDNEFIQLLLNEINNSVSLYLGNIYELFESRFDEWYGNLNYILDNIRNNVTYDYLNSELSKYANNAIYDARSNEIRLRHNNHILSRIDVSDFVIGGTLTGVEYIGDDGSEHANSLKLTFTSSGTDQYVYIPLSAVFNPDDYYTKNDIDNMLSNFGTIKKISINSTEYYPNNNGLVSLGDDFLEGVNFNVNNSDLDINSLNVAQFAPAMTGVLCVKGQDDTSVSAGDYVLVPKGDINGDGSVDIFDVNLAINLMLGNDNDAVRKERADINDDNKVDIADVNAVINLMLGKEDREYKVYKCTGVQNNIATYNKNNPISLIRGLSYYNVTNKSIIAINTKNGKVDDQNDKFNNLELRINDLWLAIQEVMDKNETDELGTIIHQNEDGQYMAYGLSILPNVAEHGALIISDAENGAVGFGTVSKTNSAVTFKTNNPKLLEIIGCETVRFVPSDTYINGSCLQQNNP